MLFPVKVALDCGLPSCKAVGSYQLLEARLLKAFTGLYRDAKITLINSLESLCILEADLEWQIKWLLSRNVSDLLYPLDSHILIMSEMITGNRFLFCVFFLK